ncbi:hypothetical protein [Aquimarina algicola]|uniref:SGNH/GDSL hydrolase family protein n=1 Tax=Aquimarina algicola TaxID=2589995 RepID=A0A504JAB8_9FLAO|nr:hypothetical protein [Aquimarina algicola]TPN87886.1 hypothetical protein FHK87_09950 [Aquimarina algicola]
MKYFISKVVLFVLPVLIALVSVNYFGDAAHIFDSKYEKKMVSIIEKKKNITNISNYDERVFQKELITTLNYNPDIIILGSSRTMMINSEYFPNKILYNNSVSGASIEDILAIYEINKVNNKNPKKIIIGIDPWLFNENNGQIRWKSIEQYYKKFHGDSDKIDLDIAKYKELISFSYFQESLLNLIGSITGSNELKETTKKYNDNATKLLDGSLVYGKDYRERDKDEVDRKAKSYVLGKIYSIEGFSSISSKIWEEFDKLIKDIRQNNIEVEFYVFPYHPHVYEKIHKEYQAVLEVENEIIRYSVEHNIKLTGSFNPQKLDMDESFFYDGMHCNERGIQKFMEYSLKQIE